MKKHRLVLRLALSALVLAALPAMAAAPARFTSVSVSFTVNTPSPPPVLRNDGYSYLVLEDGTACITDWSGKPGSLTIPAKIGGRTVSAVADNAFSDLYSLLRIDVSEELETLTIGEGAFGFCDNLRVLNAPATVLTIGGYAFSDCPNLFDLKFTASGIGAYAFSDCPRIPSFSQTAGSVPFLNIGEGAFSGCTALRTVEIGCPCAIGDDAFSGCTVLSSAGLCAVSVGDAAFSYCDALTSFAVTGENACEIGSCVAYGAEKLSSVILPETVTSIGDYSFTDAENVVIYADPGSAAEAYALENELLPVPVSEAGRYDVPAVTRVCPECGTAGMVNFCPVCGVAAPKATPVPTPSPKPAKPSPTPATVWGCDDYEELYENYPDEFEDIEEAEEFWDLNT